MSEWVVVAVVALVVAWSCFDKFIEHKYQLRGDDE